MYIALILTKFSPTCLIVTQQERFIEMTAQQNELISLGNLQILKSIYPLPHIGTDDNNSFLFNLSNYLIGFLNQFIPVLMIWSSRLIHYLISHI